MTNNDQPDDHLKACEKCGSRDFYVLQENHFRAFLRDDGVLVFNKFYCEDHTIDCRDCNAEYCFGDFEEIQEDW